MRKWIRKALTKTMLVESKGRGKKLERVEVPPSEKLILGIHFGIVALVLLCVIEALHMIFLGSFNNEVFAGITLIIGTILGAFFGAKG